MKLVTVFVIGLMVGLAVAVAVGRFVIYPQVAKEKFDFGEMQGEINAQSEIARKAPIIARLKEILARPDPALGYLNGELRFWLGWAQEGRDNRAPATETRVAASHLLGEAYENSKRDCNC